MKTLTAPIQGVAKEANKYLNLQNLAYVNNKPRNRK